MRPLYFVTSNLSFNNNIRRETSSYYRNKKKDYLKDRIDEIAMNSKNKNIETCTEE